MRRCFMVFGGGCDVEDGSCVGGQKKFYSIGKFFPLAYR